MFAVDARPWPEGWRGATEDVPPLPTTQGPIADPERRPRFGGRSLGGDTRSMTSPLPRFGTFDALRTGGAPGFGLGGYFCGVDVASRIGGALGFGLGHTFRTGGALGL